MILHPNGLPFGTVRRSPAPSFAHAILLDQFNDPHCWQVIDLYGPIETVTDEKVQHWTIVYQPADDEEWAQRDTTDSEQSSWEVVSQPVDDAWTVPDPQ